METNRRSFIKIAGIAGTGMGTGGFTSINNEVMLHADNQKNRNSMKILNKGIVPKPLDNKNFSSNTFPNITKLPSGRWLGAFKAAKIKGDCDFVHTVMTWSDDEGKVWASSFDPVKLPDINGVPDEKRMMYFLPLRGKRVLMLSCWVDSSNPSKPFFDPVNENLKDTRIFISFSVDKDEAWDTPELMNTDPPFMLKDGTIVCQSEVNKHTWNKSKWVHKSAMIFSRDGGKTWSNVVKVTEVSDMYYWDQCSNIMSDEISIVDFFWTAISNPSLYMTVTSKNKIAG